MKTKHETHPIITPAEWSALTQEERLETCVRAQLQASNAELLLHDALTRIQLAQAALNQH